jgi:AcrR family transcriptional regulator
MTGATRSYSQTQRAESTAATRQAIVAAAIRLFREEGEPDPSLEQVAELAGCSTRSVIRHFGSKEGLFEAAMAAAIDATIESRRVEPGDVAGGVRALVDHYEAMGDDVIRWLSLADRYPLVMRATEAGTKLHRELIAAGFEPDLAGLEPAERRRRLAALTAVTDVYVWHLLRRREGLSRAATEAELLALVETARRGAPSGASR